MYSGTYPENLVINHTINLIGEDKNTTVIHAPYEIENVISVLASFVNISGFKLINGYDTYGLTIETEHNSIFGNIFYDNFFGIHLPKTALYNSIYDNEFLTNVYGVVIWDARDNEITNNGFTGNFMGIEVKSGSFNNYLHHNYFRSNTQNALDSSACANHWDDSSEGNYWDDYDEASEGAYDTNSNGIIDTPYTIQGSSGCQDRFPLLSSNTPPTLPSNPIPVLHATAVNVNADLSWIGGDVNSGDIVVYDIYFGSVSNPPLRKSGHTSMSYDPGILSSSTTYYWKIIAKDSYGAFTIGPVWDFTTIYVNHPPTTPSNPTPQKGKVSVNINQDLHWYCTDSDSDPLTYDVYFDIINPPMMKVSSNQSGSLYDPGQMNYSREYYWRIVAWDTQGASSIGPLWSFQTQSQGGTGEGSPILYPNKIPFANASASYRIGFVNTPIVFNASYSYDEDGSITNYTWDFDDNSSGYGMLTTHMYEKAKVYAVHLTVTDNNGVNDTEVFTVIIGQPDTGLTPLQIYGPGTGKKNIEYDFTVVLLDPATYDIQYVFSWDDGQENATEFLATGIEYTQKHAWTRSGIFHIRVFAIDTDSNIVGTVGVPIFIDMMYCMDFGYLIDENNDGIYDLFYSNQTKATTVTEQHAPSVYLINTDEDTDWEYMYDTDNYSLASYRLPSGEGNIVSYIVLLAVVLVVIILSVFVVILNRKKQKQESEKPEPKDKKK